MTQNLVSGYLFDSYYSFYDNSMTLWIKRQIDYNNTNSKDSCICVKDSKWKNYFYVASDNNGDLHQLQNILDNEEIMSFIDSYEYVLRQEKITDNYKTKYKSKVLKLYLLPSFSSSSNRVKLANMIERLAPFQKIRLYNVDLMPDQQYFFDKDIFPFGFFEVYDKIDKDHNKKTRSELVWHNIHDSVESIDYHLPVFKNIHLSINFPKRKIINNTDELKSVTLRHFDSNGYHNQNTIVEEVTGTEKDILRNIMKIVYTIDPDFIFTDNGDSFTFPYLVERAKENEIDLYLGRDKNIPLVLLHKREGTSYFSYGRIYYKPSAFRLLGRIHIDLSNSFLFGHGSSLQGLFEISRLCRIPLHHASRATIGRCLTSLHLYTATKRGLLIPWKPILTEHVKTLRELLIADRGGLTIEPELGVHENVAEFDFVSLYPSIMVQKNISAETVRCDCCFHVSRSKVPELGYHICKKKGLVSESLEIVLKKRIQYKTLKNNTTDQFLKDVYDQRQSALKWILVTSFGYLGFNNAKFGRIDAHIAVCAFARDILLKTMHVAEDNGFDVLHGIIDSIWVKKEKENIGNRNNKHKQDYTKLKEDIENETGFKISFEGIYKWIVFLPSKTFDNIGVINRYFGVFEDGTIKARGIETRRHDTPPFLAKCQNEVLEIMANGDSIKQIQQELFLAIKKKVDEYLLKLKRREIDLKDLVFTKQLSKDYDEYQKDSLERSAIKQLEENGCYLKKGQSIQYIITENHGPFLKKVIPLQLVDDNTKYDIMRYCELLLETVNTLLDPFGIPLREDIKILDSKITNFIK